jgi:hypothetical protein
MELYILGIKVEKDGMGYRASTKRNSFNAWGWTEEEALKKLKKEIETGL